MEYSKIAYYAALFTNDLQHIYIHAAGPSMEEIRNTAQSLYYKALSDFEDLAKMAIINNEKVGNINSIRSYVPNTEWWSIEDDAVDFSKFTTYLNTNGQQYLNALKNAESERDLSERIKYWEDAVIYDNGQRMAINNSSIDAPTNPVELVNTPQNPVCTDAVVIAVPDWRAIGASSALSQSMLGN